jgi:hypothetical protein
MSKLASPGTKTFMYWEQPTGTHPHIIELKKLAELMVGVLCQQLDDCTVNGVLSETQIMTLMGEVFDEWVRPFTPAMTAHWEGGNMMRPPPAWERPSGNIQETEKVSIFSILMKNLFYCSI